MEKTITLFCKQRHAVEIEDSIRSFHVEVYHGFKSMDTSIRTQTGIVRDVVDVAGYGFRIKEYRGVGDKEYLYRQYDTHVITSRTGQVTYALAQIKLCKTLDEIKQVIQPLIVEYRVALEKDAVRGLKKELGIYTPFNPKVRSYRKQKHQPIPQIRLPWME